MTGTIVLGREFPEVREEGPFSNPDMPHLKIYTTDFCTYCVRAKTILKDIGIVDYEEVNIAGQEEMREEIAGLTGGRWDVPQVFIDGDYIGDDDALAQLAYSGELERIFSMKGNGKQGEGEVNRRDVVVIGSGPAGLAAALYASRAQLNTLVITGNEIGGQLSLTLDIENYPGFKNGGAANLIQDMQDQAKRFGAEIEMAYVTELDLSQRPFRIKTYGSEVEAQTLIVTTGSSPRKLEIPGELEYIGKGVSYCATCDGFFFKDKKIVVVGGGDAAVEEGLFLTRFATTVNIVHRRDRLRANQTLQSRATDESKIEFTWNTVVTEVLGNDKEVHAVRLKDVKTGMEKSLETDGVFIFVGHLPNTSLFEGKLTMDEKGYLVTDKRQQTNIEGVFAAGDVQDHVYRQAVTAAGTGAAAAIEAERFLAEMAGKAYV